MINLTIFKKKLFRNNLFMYKHNSNITARRTIKCQCEFIKVDNVLENMVNDLLNEKRPIIAKKTIFYI